MKKKEHTKTKLLKAVDQIVKKDGFSGLGVNKVARDAGVSKILIYRYFESFDGMVNTYIAQKDFWANYYSEQDRQSNSHLSMADQVTKLFTEKFHFFYEHCEMKALMINEFSNDHVFMSALSENSNANSKVYLPDFGVNIGKEAFNIFSMLLIAGTNQLVLHYQRQGRKADERAVLPKEELFNTIGNIVSWTLG
jgi:AcrR family transcriptional regulator